MFNFNLLLAIISHQLLQLYFLLFDLFMVFVEFFFSGMQRNFRLCNFLLCTGYVMQDGGFI
ncbi:hypothetical protein KOEU_38790 [Komagataeibacter europaeus]|uniref:Uncharacterized protein n=1 Tax=Komagataeibacter europaeus TaxID=33995 RepID=A0A0M0EBK5_KOMEU|nr:hypothetical protein KOEU_38790 [Komagataeibacter europaeus]